MAEAIGEFFSTILDYLNPFSENFILYKVIDLLLKLLDYLNPFSEKFILKDIINGISSILEWFGNFFTNLVDFFIHIFVPTEEQWAEIKDEYIDIGDTLGRHIPFVGLFSEELKKAQETVEKTDFLVITIPEIKLGSGLIGVNTEEHKVINVSEAYEPYRAYIRGGLFLIVIVLVFVYLIKYVLRYGEVQMKGGKE